MSYSREYENQLDDEVNYDEYNRNNEMINNIRYSHPTYDSIANIINYNTLNNNSLSKSYNNTNNNNNNYQDSENYQNLTNKSIQLNNLNTLNARNFSSTPTQNQNNNNSNDSNNNNNSNNNCDINLDMNQYVRQELKSRGVHYARGNSPRSIKFEEIVKKRALLNNIQNQISLTKSTKLEELKKKREEDAKYLKDMVLCYPFGRGGGGAPNRDKSGNIVTHRRNLISDPKYNFASINVDDDYNEVWVKKKE